MVVVFWMGVGLEVLDGGMGWGGGYGVGDMVVGIGYGGCGVVRCGVYGMVRGDGERDGVGCVVDDVCLGVGAEAEGKVE